LTSVQGRLGEHGTAIEYLIRFKWRTEQVRGKLVQILESLLEIAFPCVLRLRPGWCFIASDGRTRLRVSSVRVERDTV